MAKVLLHYTCCLIVLTICIDLGDGLRRRKDKFRNEVDEVQITDGDANEKKKQERIDDIVREVDLLKDMAEMVDHHIDDFYEEFPIEKSQHVARAHEKSRNFKKSFHEIESTEERFETTKEMLRKEHTSRHEKHKEFLRAKTDEIVHKKHVKTTEAITSESAKTHETKKMEDVKKYSNDQYDSADSKKPKRTTTKMSTFEASVKHRGKKRKFKDEDGDLPKKSRDESENRKHSSSREPERLKERHKKHDDENDHDKKFNDIDDKKNQRYSKATRTSPISTSRYHDKEHDRSSNKKSDIEDDSKSYKHTKTTDTTTEYTKEHSHSKGRHEDDEEYNRKSYTFKDDLKHRKFTYKTDDIRSSSDSSRKDQRGYDKEKRKGHKLLSVDDYLRTSGYTPRLESKMATPNIEDKPDESFDLQKFSETTETTSKLKMIKEPRYFRSQDSMGKADSESDNDKILYFYEPHTDVDNVETQKSEVEFTTPSSTLVPEKSTNEFSKNDYEPLKSQTKEVVGTRTWPKFEHLLEEMGKKYDWKNDRWVKFRRHKGPPKSVVHSFQDKHKFSYSTVKLNNTKTSRNFVIAVTAVR